ncbi:MAG: PD-(D/E)XK nuclease family protein [Bacteroidaceae bacterium]|nr:PD-(D/E)XK nuclease family protein [Bacteroidaceae bacterium]
MKIIYNPYLTGNAYISQNLWDVIAVGDAALLEQLLMRAGLPQTVVDDSEKAEKERTQAYVDAIMAQGDTLFSASLQSDSEGTAKQLLKWRDLLVMAGWTTANTINAGSDKLQVFASCDEALKAYPSRADRWREVYQFLKDGHEILKDTDSIEVRIPKVLIPPMIAEVLKLLPNVSYAMESLDRGLKTEGHSCTVITPNEQYEAWQLLVKLPYDAGTMLVCTDEKRLNDTMQAIGGKQWRTDRVGCPHPAATVLDQMDTPKRLVWLDCAGNGLILDPYDFLSSEERKALAIIDAETRSAMQMQWLYTTLNRIEDWILVTPKYHLGESLGEHPIITSLKQSKGFYDGACTEGQKIILPQTESTRVEKLDPIGNISIDKDVLSKILKPSDSYSAIDTLVDAPFDYLMGNMGGLDAPEDDQESNENLMKGPIAHKVVELLVKKEGTDKVYSLAEIQSRFYKQYDELFEQAMEVEKECAECAAFLKLPENKNMLALFKEDAKKSIEHLIDIIKKKGLKPLGAEYEFSTPFDPFDNPHGYVDLLLEDGCGNLVIIDLKWSNNKTYPDKIKKGEAYQLYMYKHAVEAQMAPKEVAWYAYYLFPKMELYTEPDGVTTKWDEWKEMRNNRLDQIFKEGIIEPAVNGSNSEKYPKHIILKNLKMK